MRTAHQDSELTVEAVGGRNSDWEILPYEKKIYEVVAERN